MKGRLNGKKIRIAANLSLFEQEEAHLVETMFYDEWAPSRESSVSKPSGTFVLRCEDVDNDPKPNLRELLERKRKRKEPPTTELDDLLHCVKVKTPDGKIMYKL